MLFGKKKVKVVNVIFENRHRIMKIPLFDGEKEFGVVLGNFVCRSELILGEFDLHPRELPHGFIKILKNTVLTHGNNHTMEAIIGIKAFLRRSGVYCLVHLYDFSLKGSNGRVAEFPVMAIILKKIPQPLSFHDHSQFNNLRNILFPKEHCPFKGCRRYIRAVTKENTLGIVHLDYSHILKNFDNFTHSRTANPENFCKLEFARKSVSGFQYSGENLFFELLNHLINNRLLLYWTNYHRLKDNRDGVCCKDYSHKSLNGGKIVTFVRFFIRFIDPCKRRFHNGVMDEKKFPHESEDERLVMIRIALKHNPLKSFQYAFRGIYYTFTTQNNFRIQVILGTIVAIMGFYFKVPRDEAHLLVLCIFSVLAAEMVNTSIEYLVDLYEQRYNSHAGNAKDIAAGFVLLTTLHALAQGVWIFFPYIKKILVSL